MSGSDLLRDAIYRLASLPVVVDDEDVYSRGVMVSEDDRDLIVREARALLDARPEPCPACSGRGGTLENTFWSKCKFCKSTGVRP